MLSKALLVFIFCETSDAHHATTCINYKHRDTYFYILISTCSTTSKPKVEQQFSDLPQGATSHLMLVIWNDSRR